MNRDPFTAIADPTRRHIIATLKDRPLTLNQVSHSLGGISRQAVSKQVKYLEKSGLIKVHKQGRERYCHLHLEALTEVNDWLRQYEVFWNKKLHNLGRYLKEKKHGG
jgi:DNA-binding transcriptional ArsR family regulator